MNTKELNELKSLIVRRHYKTTKVKMPLELKVNLNTAIVINDPNPSIWQLLLKLLEHLILHYHNGSSFVFKFFYFGKHIKTVKLTISLFKRLYKLLKS